LETQKPRGPGALSQYPKGVWNLKDSNSVVPLLCCQVLELNLGEIEQKEFGLTAQQPVVSEKSPKYA
jgi:hypothetical protein